MTAKRKICVATGTRAEYGLLYWLLEEIRQDPALDLQLIVTGMHLSPEFGLTYRQIEEDGFTIDAKVEMLLSSDSPVGIAKAMGLATIGFADALDRLRPDVLVVLGDRFEILAAAQAAMVARIPIAHIHGGEATEGLIDEAIRHAVTKMAHLHFVTAEPYRRRVIQMGEQPSRVFNVGAPGLDALSRLQLLDRPGLERALGFELGRPTFMVTYHPVTLSKDGPQAAMEALLEALDRFPEARIIITKPNSDTDGRLIAQLIDGYASRQSDRVFVSTSLGQLRYLSALRHVDVVIGNSSSGLIEAPAFGTPTVNLGPRQQGRLRAASVLDCAEAASAIHDAITTALSPEFRARAAEASSPYGQGGASERIKTHLAQIDLESLLFKRFFNQQVLA